MMVTNLDRSVDFYTDVLGFKIVQRYGNHYAQIAGPGIIIGLHPTAGALKPDDNISLGFLITDIEQALHMLTNFSLLYVERNERGGSFIHFNDPDGYALYFIKQNF